MRKVKSNEEVKIYMISGKNKIPITDICFNIAMRNNQTVHYKNIRTTVKKYEYFDRYMRASEMIAHNKEDVLIEVYGDKVESLVVVQMTRVPVNNTDILIEYKNTVTSLKEFMASVDILGNDSVVNRKIGELTISYVRHVNNPYIHITYVYTLNKNNK